MLIKRELYKQIIKKLQPGKVVILYGPRRVGKTFLLKKLINDSKIKKGKIAFINGDKRIAQDSLSTQNANELIDFVGRKTTLLIIDEAQKVPHIGLNLKILVDEFPHLKIIASGSASFELAEKLGEPLTGRNKTMLLYPVSAKEFINTKNKEYYLETFKQHLIYGCYPEIVNISSIQEKKEYLDYLITDYLFRDILEFERVKNSKKLRDLLSLLAFQIGNEVSLNELGNNLNLHGNTVARYLDLLEKSFIVFNIRGFSRNLRKEIYKNSRWYFYDNGIRNAVINNFNKLNLRNDIGQIWENYIVVERLKKQAYQPIFSKNYFWRTYDMKEIDWIEERDGALHGFEIKWKGSKKIKHSKEWLDTYNNSHFKLITKDNFLPFIT